MSDKFCEPNFNNGACLKCREIEPIMCPDKNKSLGDKENLSMWMQDCFREPE